MSRIEQPATRPMVAEIDHIDRLVTVWMARHGVTFARVSLGIVFLWFGGLKLVPGMSPAEGLAGDTLRVLSLGLVDPALGVPALGIWECLMGLGLLTGRFMRLTLYSFFAHMVGTVTPIVLCPDEVFTQFPFALTLEGQYILKNIVLISAAIVVGATLRGGSLRAEPTVDVYKPYAGMVTKEYEGNSPLSVD